MKIRGVLKLLLFIVIIFCGFTAHAFLFLGIPRDTYIVFYKSQRIMDGSMPFLNNWGWVDLVHYNIAQQRLTLVDAMVRPSTNTRKEITIEGRFRTALYGWVIVKRQYSILPYTNLALSKRKAIAAAIVMDMSHAEESAQEHGRIWQGTDISAFQFDDLPSVWLASLEYMGFRAPESRLSFSAKELSLMRKHFWREGLVLAGKRIEHLIDLPDQELLLSPLRRSVASVDNYWRLENSKVS